MNAPIFGSEKAQHDELTMISKDKRGRRIVTMLQIEDEELTRPFVHSRDAAKVFNIDPGIAMPIRKPAIVAASNAISTSELSGMVVVESVKHALRKLYGKLGIITYHESEIHRGVHQEEYLQNIEQMQQKIRSLPKLSFALVQHDERDGRVICCGDASCDLHMKNGEVLHVAPTTPEKIYGGSSGGYVGPHFYVKDAQKAELHIRNHNLIAPVAWDGPPME